VTGQGIQIFRFGALRIDSVKNGRFRHFSVLLELQLFFRHFLFVGFRF